MKPVVDGLQAANAGRIDFKVYADINSDDEGEELAVGNGVRAVPTMVLVGADGKELQRWTGVQPAAALQAAFDEALR